MQKKINKKKITQTPPCKPITHTGALHASVGFPNYSLNKKVSAAKVILLLIFTLLTSCKQPTTFNHTTTQAAPLIAVHLNDVSKSTVPITYFDTIDARGLYTTVAYAGGGSIKLIDITDHSLKQDVFTLSVPSLDTTPLAGITNIYQQAKAKHRNQQRIREYEKQAQHDIARYSAAVSTPHDKHYTDLIHALQLAALTLQQETFSGYTKYLLITSDMLHTQRGRKERIQPVALPNTTVLLVRPALSRDSLTALFPASTVHIFTTTQDAISFIHNHKK